MMARWCSKHSQYAESCTGCTDDFVAGFDKPVLKIKPLPTDADIEPLEAQLKEQAENIERLRDALVQCHESGCPKSPFSSFKAKPCTCGLDAALHPKEPA